jgi:glutamine synthetase
MTDFNHYSKFVKEKDVKYVDFRFTNIRGGWHHITYAITAIDEQLLKTGIMFDGSSVAGWKSIHESDMILLPDFSSMHLDPFAAQPTLNIICDVIEPSTNQPYICDPRFVAKSAEAHLKRSGIADTLYVGPEAEFFVFDNVRFDSTPYRQLAQFHSDETPSLNGKKMEEGNHAYRPDSKGAYCASNPTDAAHDMRAEMLSVMGDMGLDIEKHHHEVSPGQHELGFKYTTLVRSADWLQMYKYVVRNVANSYGKTATFMPKPIKGENGSGMHVHQSLWKNGQPLFAGNGYAGLSETALFYIGGVIKHARALNAFTNSSTNSYKRLVPGYEAPVLMAYSARNRSAACRIPYTTNPKGKRVEMRFPDGLSNPYLAFAAIMMAGLDGVKNKINPGAALDANLYELPAQQLQQIPSVCTNLREAIAALKADHQFLLDGNVFSKELINSYVQLKLDECQTYDMTPHPVEFKMYYSS